MDPGVEANGGGEQTVAPVVVIKPEQQQATV